MKHANPGEAITLRNNITKATKAVHVAALKKQEATNAACLAAAVAARAEEALKKADPKKADYNDIAAAYHDAEAKLATAVEAENLAWSAAAKAEADLSTAKARAAALCA